jgi:alkylhydroperoxidase/carboxymuconolactone decarboxylase family protein YurZ
MREGLTPEELGEALLQLLLVNGVSTWGRSHPLLQYAREWAEDPSRMDTA